MKNNILENFLKFTGNHLHQCLIFNEVADLRPVTLSRRDSGASAFLGILRNFSEHFFCRAYPASGID